MFCIYKIAFFFFFYIALHIFQKSYLDRKQCDASYNTWKKKKGFVALVGGAEYDTQWE